MKQFTLQVLHRLMTIKSILDVNRSLSSPFHPSVQNVREKASVHAASVPKITHSANRSFCQASLFYCHASINPFSPAPGDQCSLPNLDEMDLNIAGGWCAGAGQRNTNWLFKDPCEALPMTLICSYFQSKEAEEWRTTSWHSSKSSYNMNFLWNVSVQLDNKGKPAIFLLLCSHPSLR